LNSQALQAFFTQRIDIEHEADLKGRAHGGIQLLIFRVKPFSLSDWWLMAGAPGKDGGPNGIFNNGIDLFIRIAQVLQRR